MTLTALSESQLRAAFWVAQRRAVATVTNNEAAYQAAVADKLAIVAEQHARFTARALERDARVAALLGR